MKEVNKKNLNTQFNKIKKIINNINLNYKL